MKKIILLGSVIFVVSCQRTENFTHETTGKTHFVSYETIGKIVKNGNFKKFLSKFDKNNKFSKTVTSDSLSITDSREFKDKNGVTAFYFTKLSNNDFVLFAADDRSHAIMGVMDNPENTSISGLPSEFSYWLEDEINAIEFARDHNVAQTDEIHKEWQTYKMMPTATNTPYQCNAAYSETKEALLTTKWGQGDGFNNYTPFGNCSNSANGHTPTGCVATATAQIMKYYQYPNNYNWSNMPNNYGSDETSILMHDIGVKVGMNYACDGSGTKASTVEGALKYSFGYSQAFAGDYDYNTAVSEISQNYPVLISGGEKKYWAGIIPYYADGHAWVADGYIRGFECFFDENGYVNGGYGYLLLHINWGWEYGMYNGYFGYNNFSVGNYSFNYKNKMIYGIRK